MGSGLPPWGWYVPTMAQEEKQVPEKRSLQPPIRVALGTVSESWAGGVCCSYHAQHKGRLKHKGSSLHPFR